MAEYHLDIIEKEEIHFPRLPTDDAELTVSRVAHEFWGPKMRIRGEAHGRQVLIFVVRGSGWFLTPRGDVEVVSSMVLTFGGGECFDIRTGPDRTMEIYIVPCGGRGSEAVLKTILGRNLGAFTLAHPFAVQELFEAMFIEAKRGGRYAHDICVHYIQIALRRIAVDRLRRSPRASRAQQSLQLCRSYIDQHFSRLRAVSEVADACGLSQAYLTRLFQRYEQMSPYEYLTRLKLNKAIQLLLTTDLAVHEVAAELNYDDPYTFSRSFKRILGVSPQRYRAGR